MTSIQIIQIMAILYFLFALRLKTWKTSLNTFIVISGFFIIVVSREIEWCLSIWIDYHMTIIGIIMTIIMARATYQSVYKKYLENKREC